jgi:hypothetical protein
MVIRPGRVLLLGALVVSLLVGTATAQEATPEGAELGGMTVLPPEASYAGVSRAEWSAHFLQWALSLPQEINPNFDPTGEQCGYGQSGPIFFLPAAYVPEPYDRTCVIPAGTAIYVQVGGTSCSSVEPPPYFGRDEAELQACAAAEAYTVPHTIAINGQELSDLQAYRTTSPLFTLRLAADNLLGVPPGVGLAVMEGSSIIIAPPPPGEYEITLTADFGDEVLPGTTRVIVAAPQVIEPATPGAGTARGTPAVS